MDKTNQELALILLNRLIDLEAERLAMAGILIHVKTQDRMPLDWRAEVKSECGPFGRTRDDAKRIFEKLSKQLESSSADCPDALALLASAPTNSIWEVTT